jgi:chromosomal replication initiation ATPase DnaA
MAPKREIVEQAVALVFRVPAGELRAPTRRKAKVAFARQVAMYLAHVAYGLSLTQVGTLFGRDRTTVAHACTVVEDRRDEPVFDRSLDHLEVAIRTLAKAWIELQAECRL